MVRLVGAFDSCKGNCLQSAFTGLHPPDGTNPQMALIYRGSAQKNARKVPASQMQAGRCNNFLIRSGRFGISMAVQKSLIPRVQFWVTSKVAHSARQGQVQAGPGQGQARCRARGRCRSFFPVLPCPGCLWGPVSRGLALAVLPCCWPVPWGPWPGEGRTLRWIDISRGRHAQSVRACWGWHCWAGLPTEGPPVAELAQVSADPVVNRTVPMGLASVH